MKTAMILLNITVVKIQTAIKTTVFTASKWRTGGLILAVRANTQSIKSTFVLLWILMKDTDSAPVPPSGLRSFSLSSCLKECRIKLTPVSKCYIIR